LTQQPYRDIIKVVEDGIIYIGPGKDRGLETRAREQEPVVVSMPSEKKEA